MDDNEETITLKMSELRRKNNLLWRFVKLEFPFASGDLDTYVDIAIQKAEYERKPTTP